MSFPRKKQEANICCLSCGYTGKSFVLEDERGIINPSTRCQKCSNIAYTISMVGVFLFMQAVTKDIVRMKGEIFDLEAASDTEDR